MFSFFAEKIFAFAFLPTTRRLFRGFKLLAHGRGVSPRPGALCPGDDQSP